MVGSNSNNNTEKALEEFRNAWKQEVQKKQVYEKPKENDTLTEPKKVEEEGVAEIIDKTESLNVGTPVTAMDHYVAAIDNERQGKLGPGNTFIFFFFIKCFFFCTYYIICSTCWIPSCF